MPNNSHTCAACLDNVVDTCSSGHLGIRCSSRIILSGINFVCISSVRAETIRVSSGYRQLHYIYRLPHNAFSLEM